MNKFFLKEKNVAWFERNKKEMIDKEKEVKRKSCKSVSRHALEGRHDTPKKFV